MKIRKQHTNWPGRILWTPYDCY